MFLLSATMVDMMYYDVVNQTYEKLNIVGLDANVLYVGEQDVLNSIMLKLILEKNLFANRRLCYVIICLNGFVYKLLS